MENLCSARRFTAADGTSVLLKAIVANLGVQIVAAIVLAVATAATGKDMSQNNVLNAIFMMLIQAAYFFVVFAHVRGHKKPLVYGLDKRVTPAGVFIPAAMSILALIGFYAAAQWFDVFLSAIGYQGIVGISFDTPAGTVLTILASVVMAPICEEMVFRGALLSGLKTVCKDYQAILLSGLAFALMHMNPQQLVFQFFLGCTCAYAVLKSGSLIPAVIIHAVNNFIAVLLEITPLGTAFEALLNLIAGNLAVAIVVSVAATAAGVTALYFIGKCIKRHPRVSEEDERRKKAEAAEAAPKPPDEVVKHVEVMPEGGILGKSTAKICYIASIGICLFMWIFTFIASMV